MRRLIFRPCSNASREKRRHNGSRSVGAQSRAAFGIADRSTLAPCEQATGAAFLNDRTAVQRLNPSNMEERVSRFLLALIRNFGVAIAISVFFAAAREPHPPRPGTVDTLAAAGSDHDLRTPD